MDKFENIIKQSVEGYEAPFNPQAWENVSKDLGDSFDQAIKDSAGKYEAPYNPAAWEAVSSQLGPAYSVWKWLAGAAAVVAAVVGTVYITNQGGDSDNNLSNNDNSSSELAVNTATDNNVGSENLLIDDDNPIVNAIVTDIIENDNISNTNNNSNVVDNGANNNNIASLPDDQVITPNVIIEDSSNPFANSNNPNLNSGNPTSEAVYSVDAGFTTSETEICAGNKCMFSPEQPNSELIYLWNFGDGAISSEMATEHKFNRFGEFTVKLEVKHPKTNKTLASSKETITVNSLPKTDFTWEQSDEIIPIVNFINLTDEGSKWNWNIKGLKQSSQDEFEYTFRKAGQYVIDLTATNEFGCSKTSQKTIMIEQDYNLLAPTAFSPNGDFKNDVFIPKALQIMDGVQFTMNIMSKSGERVYTTSNVNEPWDGVNMNDNT
ncbi:MAG: PKD domain-containing protein, partial [Crocinitomicaceae bacterium]|nr:PKD domain-containing protein [Crocinitomicaceae bacterium]